MLTDIKYIRFWERVVEQSSNKFNTTYVYEGRAILASYISAIFHAQLYDKGDFELTCYYDDIMQNNLLEPLMGYYIGDYFTRNDMFVELCGQQSGIRAESRLFKVTQVSIVNDDSNNKTVKIVGVGALGIYASMPLVRISQASSVKEDSDGYLAPDILLLSGYEDTNNYHATPLEHLYRMMILPIGVDGGARDTIIGYDLYCPDMGLWIVQDTSAGTGDALTTAQESTGLQADFTKWACDFCETYNIGVVSAEMSWASDAKVEAGASSERYAAKLTIKKTSASNLRVSDRNGTFTLTQIDFAVGNSLSVCPIVYGQENETTEASKPQKIAGQYLSNVNVSLHAEGSTLSLGGNVVKDSVTYYAPYDVVKPPLLKSSNAIEYVNTDDLRREICNRYAEESLQKGVGYSNTIAISGVINVSAGMDIALGDIITIDVLDGTFTQQVTVVGLTYVSEGDGFKIEVDYV